MGNIGDLLSNTQKAKLIQNTLSVGSVYRMKLTKNEGVKPKNKEDDSRNKYFVILGFDDVGNVIGFVLINTHVNEELSDVIKDLHYPIKASQYPFLGKDRFVDCSELKEISKDKFVEMFSGEKEKGQILSDDLDCIIGAVNTSPKVTVKQLKKFGLIRDN